MAQAELFADEYKVDLDVFEKQKGLKQKGSDLIATVNYHSKETWRQQTE